MKGNDSENTVLPQPGLAETSVPNYLRHAIQHMFGIVHSVILTLITFGLVSWVPSFISWSFTLLGCIILPLLSFILTLFCNWCVSYVTEGSVTVRSLLRSAWMPPLGIFCSTVLLLPLKVMQSSGLGPLNMMVATSIFVNAILVWILQVYSSRPQLAVGLRKSDYHDSSRPQSQPHSSISPSIVSDGSSPT
jgi:hypothetical protein